MATFRYNLSQAFMAARFVETGERPNVHQTVQFDIKRLSPTQRATLARVSSEDHSGWLLLNPEVTRRGQPNPTFDRLLSPDDVPRVIDQLATIDTRESSRPLTIRIRNDLLDQVRAYASAHDLKTDGAAISELIEVGLRARVT